MEDMDRKIGECYAIINNIPVDYHSADLRNYFSQFIEEKGFDCFHFRHRPEQVQTENEQNTLSNHACEKSKTHNKRSTCCVIRLKVDKLRKLIKMYQRKHWIDKRGEIMRQICYISKIREPNDTSNSQFLTRAETKLIPEDRETFTIIDLHKLPELHPPDIMPNGNVGTPTVHFMDLIKQCRLPPSVIKKLGLTFPKTKTNKRYGNVSYDYGQDVVTLNSSDGETTEIFTASGHQIPAVSDNSVDLTHNTNDDKSSSKDPSNSNDTGGLKTACSDQLKSKNRQKKKGYIDKEMKRRMNLKIEEKMIGEEPDSEEDNDSCEEWERHEALYDDPSNQERNRERLFEEEIELKWEKGGSGLVFYTDAQYWQAQEGDFDEQAADDWDVDMSVYYEDGAGDKDARDYITMRQEKRRRDGIEETDRFTAGIAKRQMFKPSATEKTTKIGDFEGHTRGIGRKILEEQGWKEGEGLGSSVQGIADALENEGQDPRARTGLGYHGEKLNRYHHRPAQRKVIISTIYDDPKLTDPHEPLRRRHEPYTLKYRDEIQFSKATDT